MKLENVKDENSLNNSEIESDIIIPSIGDTQRAIIELTGTAKNAITRNNIKLIMFINILILILFMIGVSYYRWYQLDPLISSSSELMTPSQLMNAASHTIYMNFYLIVEVTSNANDSNNTSNIEIHTIIFSILFQPCTKLNMSNININCSYLVNSAIAASAAGGIFSLGVILHTINIFQLGQLLKKVDDGGLKINCIGVDKIQVSIFLLYFAALLYSWIELCLLLDFRIDFSGAITYYAGILLLYLLTIFWFTWVYKRGLRHAMVNRLLLYEGQSNDDVLSETDKK